jgi:predicted N-formylglutamate amidohydrolase
MRRRPHLLVSCEHGGNEVPAAYAPLFAGAAAVLDSHRGLDYGALEAAQAFGARLGVAPITATTTRLVVDLNRSLGHRNLFSEYTRVLDREQRAAALSAHYRPYRERVEREVAHSVASGAIVVHVSAHSFTPVLRGAVRNCDVGFLYDPARPAERRFIAAWHDALAKLAPDLRVRRNYPYRGVADSLVTRLRRLHGDESYAGVEVEINQKHVATPSWPALLAAVTAALAHAVDDTSR